MGKPATDLEIREFVKTLLGDENSATQATMREVVVEAIKKWEDRWVVWSDPQKEQKP